MRIAVLGLGFMGATHVRALQEIAGAELAAVYSSDERKLAGDLSGAGGNLATATATVDFSGVRRYRRIEAVLADDTIEAVDICLPTWLHDTVAIQALNAGKHVLVEKPMALDGFCADRMIAASRTSERVLMAAHVLRFFPEFRALRDVMLQEAHGRARVASFRRRCAAPGWSQWFGDHALSGGGIFDLLIHDVDMALHLFGKPAAVRASGWLDAERAVDIIDAQLFYEDGTLVTIAGGWHHAGAYPFAAEYSVVLEGGVVEFSTAGRVPTLYAGGSQQELELSGADGYRTEIEYFLECCQAGREPELCRPEESADAVRLMLLLEQARQRNGEKLECGI